MMIDWLLILYVVFPTPKESMVKYKQSYLITSAEFQPLAWDTRAECVQRGKEEMLLNRIYVDYSCVPFIRKHK